MPPFDTLTLNEISLCYVCADDHPEGETCIALMDSDHGCACVCDSGKDWTGLPADFKDRLRGY